MKRGVRFLRRDTWLSKVVPKAEKQAIAQTGFITPLRAAARAAWSSVNDTISGLRDFIPALLIIAALHLVAFLGPAPCLPPFSEMRQFLLTLWQVTGAVVGLALVILIPVVQMLSQAARSQYLWQRFLKHSRFYFIAPFLFGSILAAGIGSLLLLPSSSSVEPVPAGLGNLLLIDTGLFVFSVFLLLWLYARVLRFLNPDWVRTFAIDSLCQDVRKSIAGDISARHSEHILRNACADAGLVYDPHPLNQHDLRPVPIEKSGVVSDVNLDGLARVALSLTTTSSPRAVISIRIGAKVTGVETCAYVHAEDATDEVQLRLRRCFKVTNKKGRE